MSKIDATFTATLKKGKNKGSWIYVIWPESVKFFETKGTVKVAGTVDGQSFQTSFMPMGDGSHMLPVKVDIRKLINKGPGDTVTIRITERLEH
jgi:hypothetical protein